MAKARAHLVIHGRVQGVFFRYTAKDVADRLGLTGWVRNRRDGTVEAVAEGDKEKLEEFIKWCHRGPDLARVTKVEVNWENPTGEFDSFKVAYTA